MRRVLTLVLLSFACVGGETLNPAPVPPPAPPEVSTSAAAPPAPLLDGNVSEWSELSPLAVDPVGDASGNFDVTTVYATSRATRLYLSFDTGATLNLYAGLPSDGTLQINIAAGDSTMAIDLRQRIAVIDGFKTLAWYGLDLITAPTHAANQFEMGVDLAVLGVNVGDTIQIGFSGSDDVEAVPFELVLAAPPPQLRSMARAEGSDVRIASLNTYLGGLVDTQRWAPIARMLRAVAADVVCLQELGQTSPGAIAQRLAATDGSDKNDWNVHKVSVGSIVGNVVASRHELIPIPSVVPRFAGAVVLLDDQPLAVFSVHLKCCGFAGSSEDVQRLAEAAQLNDTIDALRGTELGQALAPYANVPVVIVGDFNDVGSATLEQSMIDRGLQRWILQHLPGDAVYTWSSLDESYPPGMLDLLFHGDDIERRGGYVLDTLELAPDVLAAAEMQVNDSYASDHLLLVADFARPALP
jgi:endonuclease/exonuclease/phosphatase family metal-dependent hydrolase